VQVESKQPYSLEAADSNAIEEVNLAYENVKEVECLDISKEGCEAWDAAVKRYEERIGKKMATLFLAN
jgi:dynein heavy chain 1, cytosolic